MRLPLPPGCSPTLWGSDERWIETYLSRFPGYYMTADAGYVDEDGYVFVMSRIDDVINTAGHRLSTGAMEEVLAGHPDVAECAVFGVADELKGQVPIGFAVLKAGVERDPAEVAAELVALVREQIGPVASFKHALIVTALPKTRSGKVLRGTMRKIADGEDWRVPPTIDDRARARRDRGEARGARIPGGCRRTQASGAGRLRAAGRRATAGCRWRPSPPAAPPSESRGPLPRR